MSPYSSQGWSSSGPICPHQTSLLPPGQDPPPKAASSPLSVWGECSVLSHSQTPGKAVAWGWGDEWGEALQGFWGQAGWEVMGQFPTKVIREAYTCHFPDRSGLSSAKPLPLPHPPPPAPSPVGLALSQRPGGSGLTRR